MWQISINQIAKSPPGVNFCPLFFFLSPTVFFIFGFHCMRSELNPSLVVFFQLPRQLGQISSLQLLFFGRSLFLSCILFFVFNRFLFHLPRQLGQTSSLLPAGQSSAWFETWGFSGGWWWIDVTTAILFWSFWFKPGGWVFAIHMLVQTLVFSFWKGGGWGFNFPCYPHVSHGSPI